VEFSASSHELKLEYFECGGSDVALLSWTLVSGFSCLRDVPLIGATIELKAGRTLQQPQSQGCPRDAVRNIPITNNDVFRKAPPIREKCMSKHAQSKESRSQVMKRLRPVILFITIASLVVGAAAAIVAFNKRDLSTGGVSPGEGARVASPAVPAPQAFVPDGLPIVFSNLSAVTENRGDNKQAFVSAVQFQVATSGGDQVTSLNLMVFEFDSEGKLR
jgi:hypothetical protein